MYSTVPYRRQMDSSNATVGETRVAPGGRGQYDRGSGAAVRLPKTTLGCEDFANTQQPVRYPQNTFVDTIRRNRLKL